MSLSKADKFYLDTHRDKKSEADMAKDLGKPVKVVRDYLKKTKPKPKTFFQEHNGTVAMTAVQSAAGDDARKLTNKEFYDERKNCIHVIDPDKPVR